MSKTILHRLPSHITPTKNLHWNQMWYNRNEKNNKGEKKTNEN